MKRYQARFRRSIVFVILLTVPLVAMGTNDQQDPNAPGAALRDLETTFVQSLEYELVDVLSIIGGEPSGAGELQGTDTHLMFASSVTIRDKLLTDGGAISEGTDLDSFERMVVSASRSIEFAVHRGEDVETERHEHASSVSGRELKYEWHSDQQEYRADLSTSEGDECEMLKLPGPATVRTIAEFLGNKDWRLGDCHQLDIGLLDPLLRAGGDLQYCDRKNGKNVGLSDPLLPLRGSLDGSLWGTLLETRDVDGLQFQRIALEGLVRGVYEYPAVENAQGSTVVRSDQASMLMSGEILICISDWSVFECLIEGPVTFSMLTTTEAPNTPVGELVGRVLTLSKGTARMKTSTRWM